MSTGFLPIDCYCHKLDYGDACEPCKEAAREEDRRTEVPKPQLDITIPEGEQPLSPPEIKDMNAKAWGMFKNHLHNTLGVTTEWVQRAIEEVVSQERQAITSRVKQIETDASEAIKKLLGVSQDQPSDWFKSNVRTILINEINQAIRTAKVNGKPVSTFQDFVRITIEEEVKKQVMAKLKVDVRLSFIEPQENELREVLDPNDFRGARE